MKIGKYMHRKIVPLFFGTPEHIVELDDDLICWCSTMSVAQMIADALNTAEQTPVKSKLHLVKTINREDSATEYFLIHEIKELVAESFTDETRFITEVFTGEQEIARELHSAYQGLALLGSL